MQVNEASKRGGALSYFSLFSSLGTLVCCALPSLLVLFGLGATVATVLSQAPWLVSLSQHKTWVFSVSGALIASNFLYVYWLGPKLQQRNASCEPGGACQTASRFSKAVLWFSAAVYLAGCFSAFLLGPILVHFE
jgi:mercuric ion transport protein